MILVKGITKDDDLRQLVAEINSALWDDANEMSEGDTGALSDLVGYCVFEVGSQSV